MLICRHHTSCDSFRPFVSAHVENTPLIFRICTRPHAYFSRCASCLRQVKTMKDEKQELLRVIEELRAENGNLQVLTWRCTS